MIFGDGPIGSGAIGNNNLLIIEVSNDGQLYLSGATDVEANLTHFQVYSIAYYVCHYTTQRATLFRGIS